MVSRLGGVGVSIWTQIFRVFVRHPSIEVLALFGSRANGRFHSGSDIDLAVISSDLSPDEFDAFWHAIDSLPIAFPLDLLHYDKVEKPALKDAILRDHKPIMRRSEGRLSMRFPVATHEGNEQELELRCLPSASQKKMEQLGIGDTLVLSEDGWGGAFDNEYRAVVREVLADGILRLQITEVFSDGKRVVAESSSLFGAHLCVPAEFCVSKTLVA